MRPPDPLNSVPYPPPREGETPADGSDFTEEDHFLALLDRPATERTRYLETVYPAGDERRRRVEQWLADHEAAGGFLRRVWDTTGSRGTSRGASPLASGARVGEYVLGEKLGEGGFGTVFVAQQERPIRRQVALKILKAGMDTWEVVCRFEAERQALALMDHPGIAKVFDAGMSDQGLPFFAMEWVSGVRITEYCDRHRLGLEARILLFIEVCQAVQHAHQKGIIHRDLKPSNILVSGEPSHPAPKVIDFGIAKALEGRLSEATVHTGRDQFLGTPAYMSPEQAGSGSGPGPGSGARDLDTRSDIYSLGVLLHELLTGDTPFGAADLGRCAPDEVRRILRDVDPPRPSARLAALPKERLAEVATRRGLLPARLVRRLRGDLDGILLKCLEKDRSRRYPTANALSADLRRHLANEPVVARPPGPLDRFRKTWRRHRVAMASGLVSAVAVIGGLAASVLLYVSEVRARRAVERAERGQHLAFLGAEQQRRSAERWLARSQVDAGWALWEEGDYPGAMGAFTNALRLDGVEAGRHRMHQRRVRAVERGHPELRRVWPLGLPATAARFAPDRRRVLIATQTPEGTGQAGVYDSDSGEARSALLRHAAPIRVVDLHPGTGRVLTGSDDGTIRIWRVGPGALEAAGAAAGPPAAVGEPVLVRLGQPVVAAVFSPDGTRMAAGGTSGAQHAKGGVGIWDAGTGERLWWEEEAGWTLRTLAFSPDGSRLAAGSFTFSGVLFDVLRQADGPLPHCWRAHGLAFSPDGRRLAIAGAFTSSGSETGARILDLASGLYPGPLLWHPRDARAVEFSPDGSRLASGGYDLAAQIWDTATGMPATPRLPHRGVVTRLRFEPGGRRLLSEDSRGRLRLWEVATGLPSTHVLRHGAPLLEAEFDPASGDVRTVTTEGSVFRWSARPAFPPTLTLQEAGPVLTVTPFPSPDAALAVAHPGGVTVRRLTDGSVVSRMSGTFTPLTRALHPLAGGVVSVAADRLASFGAGGDEAWQRSAPGGFGGDWASARITPGGLRIALLGDGKPGILEVDPASGRDARRFESGFIVSSAAWTPDGTRLAGFGVDRECALWEAATGRVLHQGRLARVAATVQEALFSETGRWVLLRVENRPAEVYPSAELPEGPRPALLGNSANCAAFAPGDRYVAVGDHDGFVEVRNLERLSGELPPIRHRGAVTRLAFSPDGTLLFTGSADGTARAWDPETGQPVTPPLIHGQAVSGLVVDPATGMLWTGSHDGLVRAWPLEGARSALAAGR